MSNFILNKGIHHKKKFFRIKIFFFSARVGYEQIYRALYDGLGMRVHVEQTQYDFFACLPIIQECLTTDPTTTRLHICRTPSSNYTEPCSLFRNCDKPIRILLSIMWFTEQISASELLVKYNEYHSNFDQNLSKRCIGYQDYDNNHVDIAYRDKYLNYRLCYSLHSSFSEIIDVLKTLKPQRVTPIAAPLITLLPTKRLFQLINYFIEDKYSTSIIINKKLHEKMINHQIQLKHRYESFETKIERKRRRKLFKQQQQRKANDEELDLGTNDEREELFLQRINSLNHSKSFFRCVTQDQTNQLNNHHLFEEITPSSSQIISIEEDSSNSDDKSGILPDDLSSEIIPMNIDQPVESPSIDNNCECAMSDTSSDTVDYDFDTETYSTLTFESQESIIPLSDCQNNEH